MSTLEDILDEHELPRTIDEGAVFLADIPCPPPLRPIDYFGSKFPSVDAYASLLTRCPDLFVVLQNSFQERDFTPFWTAVIGSCCIFPKYAADINSPR